MFQIRQYLFLLITAIIWGSAFVGQKLGINHVSPYTFTFFRTLIGALFLLPVIYILGNISKSRGSLLRSTNRKSMLIGSVLCGICLLAAESFQQFGMVHTDVNKASFITSMYILFVPLLGVFLGHRLSLKISVAIAISVAGLYLLCMKGSFSLLQGDFLIVVCAIVFALHILVISYFVNRVDGVVLSCGQFFVASFFGMIMMFIYDTPTYEDLLAAAPAILYVGILSNGVAYTLQVVGQRGINPTIATLIMSLESVFGSLFGVFYLNEVMTFREVLGCILMFIAVVIAQMPSFHKAKV